MRLLFFLIFSFGVFLPVVYSQEKKLVYDDIDVVMRVNQDFSIDVEEKQRVTLTGDWNWLARYYSLKDCSDIQILSVSQDNQQYVNGNIDRKGHYSSKKENKADVAVKWRSRDINDPPYFNYTTTFTIRYRIKGAISSLGEKYILDWKPLFFSAHTIRQANVTVILSEKPNRLLTLLITDEKDSRGMILDDGKTIQYTKNQPSDNQFRIVVKAYNGGWADLQCIYDRFCGWWIPIILGVLLVGFFSGITLGRLFGQIGSSEEYQDITDLPPGVVGVIADCSFDLHDLGATIIDFARRGIISITTMQTDTMEYELKLLVDTESIELMKFELTILKDLFPRRKVGEKHTIVSVRNSFFYSMSKIKSVLWEELESLNIFYNSLPQMKLVAQVVGGGLIVCGTGLCMMNSFYFGIALGFIIFALLFVWSYWKKARYNGEELGSVLFVCFWVLIIPGLFLWGGAYAVTLNYLFEAGVAFAMFGCFIFHSGRLLVRRSSKGYALAKLCRRFIHNPESAVDSEQVEQLEDILPWLIALKDIKGMKMFYDCLDVRQLSYIGSKDGSDIFIVSKFNGVEPAAGKDLHFYSSQGGYKHFNGSYHNTFYASGRAAGKNGGFRVKGAPCSREL